MTSREELEDKRLPILMVDVMLLLAVGRSILVVDCLHLYFVIYWGEKRIPSRPSLPFYCSHHTPSPHTHNLSLVMKNEYVHHYYNYCIISTCDM